MKILGTLLTIIGIIYLTYVCVGETHQIFIAVPALTVGLITLNESELTE